LYDVDIKDIKDNFLVTEFLDPKLYYRLLEEYFNVNIYVITNKLVEVPKYTLFHARPVRSYRPTLLIYKHQNQCELIINDNQYLYHDDMTIYCHDFLQQLLTELS
jgi:hypothetical protein